jgi:hypothetical protein
MIPAVIIKDDKAFVPIIGTNEYVCLIWKEDGDNCEEVRRWCTLRTNICFDEAYRSVNIPDSVKQILNVYKIKDSENGVPFFLVAFDQLQDFEDIGHCVALPYNKLNLIKFYKDYLMTFPDTLDEDDE